MLHFLLFPVEKTVLEIRKGMKTISKTNEADGILLAANSKEITFRQLGMRWPGKPKAFLTVS